MIEKIGAGKTRRRSRARELLQKIWIRSADHHTGQRLLERPHSEGLREVRTRSLGYKVGNLLNRGRQPEKNDDRGAEAIAEAATRPTVRFVELKNVEHFNTSYGRTWVMKV